MDQIETINLYGEKINGCIIREYTNSEANGTSLRTGNCMNAPDMMALSTNGLNRKSSKEN